MKRSGYRISYHIYLLFLVAVVTVVLSIAIYLLRMITVKLPSGAYQRTNWAQTFAKDFKEQLIMVDGKLQVSQKGLKQLQDEKIGLQLLDDEGNEIFAFQKPEDAKSNYSYVELLAIENKTRADQDEMLALIESLSYEGESYLYIVYLPVKINKVMMYLNGDYMTNGKSIFLRGIFMLLIVIVIAGGAYGFYTAKAISHLTLSIQAIFKRQYVSRSKGGIFSDIYEGLDQLDQKIRSSDEEREKTETMRKEWIANITHDLKTPLSPIKGYAEILQNDYRKSEEECKQYARIMLKNAGYMESLIDDLKLTYQLESDMLPIKLEKQNFVTFFKELIIDVLNRPEYEEREIQFETSISKIVFSFDEKLLRRAFQNLIVNAFVHGDETTHLHIKLEVKDKKLQIMLADNGKGMTKEEIERLFERYYRGSNTEKKVEGTGLGLAIAKNIINKHGGMITVSSEVGIGTTFLITFKVN